MRTSVREVSDIGIFTTKRPSSGRTGTSAISGAGVARTSSGAPPIVSGRKSIPGPVDLLESTMRNPQPRNLLLPARGKLWGEAKGTAGGFAGGSRPSSFDFSHFAAGPMKLQDRKTDEQTVLPHACDTIENVHIEWPAMNTTRWRVRRELRRPSTRSQVGEFLHRTLRSSRRTKALGEIG